MHKISAWPRILKWFVRSLVSQCFGRNSQAFAVEGTYECGTGRESLVVLVIASASIAADANQVFFQGSGTVRLLGRTFRFFPQRSLKRWAGIGADFVLVELPPWRRRIPTGSLGLQTELDAVYKEVTGDLDSFVNAHFNDGLRGNLRRAHSENYGVEFTQKVEDIEIFYRDFFIPMAKGRHAEQAFIPPISEILARKNHLTVAFLCNGRERLAGHLYLHSRLHGNLRVWKMGARLDIYENRKVFGTVNIALNYRALEYALQNGFTTVSLGVMLPVISHGIFSNKARMGVKSQLLPDFPLCTLEICNKAKVAFFEQRPIAVIRNQKIVGLFHLKEPPLELQTCVRELSRKYTLSSIDGIAVINTAGEIVEFPLTDNARAV